MLACLLVAALVGFWALRRRGPARGVGLAVAAAALAGAIVFVISEGSVLANVIVVVCFIGSIGAARQAFRVHVRLPRAPAPERAVMFFNPRSGGGKATKFHLADEAERRGIKAIELVPGTDLEELVRAAVADGADALAMAGGDGSQAIVAKVAAEIGLPYACIPSGTRNHFALDLGVDRDDVVGALDALVDGGERTVDLAEVNGRVFVNNVSLGLYADAVQKESYRNAKLRTLLDTVPDALGPEAAPVPLRWRSDGGDETGLALLVSNNPYRLMRALASGTRPRMDEGVLGVAVVGAAGLDAGARARRRRTGARRHCDSSPRRHSRSTAIGRFPRGSTARRPSSTRRCVSSADQAFSACASRPRIRAPLRRRLCPTETGTPC